MEWIERLFCLFENHLDFILALFGALLAWYIYKKEVKCKLVRKLAKEVIAFYCVEQEAVQRIHELTGDNEVSIQRDLRNRAQRNDNNLEGVRPDMSANGARKLL